MSKTRRGDALWFVSSWGRNRLTDYIAASGVVSSGLTLNPGDTVTVSSGGATVSTSNDGLETVLSGGVARNTIIASAGVEGVSLGGMSIGAVVNGGNEVVDGVAASVTVNQGGDLFIDSGGLASGVTISGVGGNDGLGYVDSGGVISNATVLANGFLDILAGGVARNVTVSSGGVVQINQEVASGVTAVISAAVQGGAVSAPLVFDGVTVSAGGVIGLTFVVSSGGILDLTSGAVVGSGGTVAAGGVLSGPGVLEGFTYDTGLAKGVTVGLAGSGGAFGYLEVLGGGISLGAVVRYGQVDVASGANAVASILSGVGDYQYVGSGGAASSTIVGSGGQEFVDSGGGAYGSVVLSGGTETIVDGAFAANVTVSSGGTLVLDQTVARSEEHTSEL